jgi:hypothetical protein
MIVRTLRPSCSTRDSGIFLLRGADFNFRRLALGRLGGRSRSLGRSSRLSRSLGRNGRGLGHRGLGGLFDRRLLFRFGGLLGLQLGQRRLHMVHLPTGRRGLRRCRGSRDRSRLRGLPARTIYVNDHAIGVGQGKDPVILHGHQIEGDSGPRGRIRDDLDLRQDPVLDGARGHDIGGDAGLLQGDLQLLVAVLGPFHQGALVVHILGHVHDHAGVIGARPVTNAEQGQPFLELCR